MTARSLKMADLTRLLALALLASVLAVPASAFTTDGPLYEITTQTDLFCGRIAHEAVDHPFDGEGDTGRVNDCGTLVHVDQTEELYGPGQISGSSFVFTWNSVSGEGLGSGTAADPARSVTIVEAPNAEASIRVEETNSYVEGDDAYLTTITVENIGQAGRTGTLYRRSGCGRRTTMGDSVIALTHVVEEGTGGQLTCTYVDDDDNVEFTDERMVATALTEGFSTVGGTRGDAHGAESTGAAYPGCATCGERLPDDAYGYVGYSWDFNLQPGQTATYQVAFAFAPEGGEIAALPTGVGAPPAGAGITRLSGPSRVETAVAISADTFADAGGFAGSGGTPALAVVLATAGNFPDSLAAGPLAVAQQAPLLLTGSSSLHSATAAEIQRVLSPGGTVFILGGTAALSDDVEQAVRDLGYDVQRLGGADRVETALLVAQAANDDPSAIWIADGGTFGDALIAGATAAGQTGHVTVLTTANAVPQSVQNYIDAEGVEVFAVGSIADVYTATPDGNRYRGGDVFSRAAQVAGDDEFFNADGTSAVAVASGENFPDALAGGAHAGRLGIPLLLSTADEASPAAIDAAEALRPLGAAYLYGGEAALGPAVADAFASLVS